MRYTCEKMCVYVYNKNEKKNYTCVQKTHTRKTGHKKNDELTGKFERSIARTNKKNK